MTAQRRKVGCTWHLRALMAEHGMFQTVDLVEPLAERGIVLSVSQVHRLVTGTPERLSLPTLAALCDIFGVAPNDLVTTEASNVGVRAVAGGERPTPAPGELRPRRARVIGPG